MEAINKICAKYAYVPVLTEIQGIDLIGKGIRLLGQSCMFKISDSMSGKESIVLYFGNASGCAKEFGITAIMQGFKRILPATGVLLAAYVLRNRVL